MLVGREQGSVRAYGYNRTVVQTSVDQLHCFELGGIGENCIASSLSRRHSDVRSIEYPTRRESASVD